MTDPHHVPSGETGVVRVFTTDLEPRGDAAITKGNVAKLLGRGVTLDPTKVEVFPARMIEPLGLRHYLSEGYGIPDETLAGKAAVLEALSGLVILIPSTAFGGQEQKLEPNGALRFIGAFHEPAAGPPVKMAPTASAEGRTTPPKTHYDALATRERRWHWVLALASLLAAAALVILIVF